MKKTSYRLLTLVLAAMLAQGAYLPRSLAQEDDLGKLFEDDAEEMNNQPPPGTFQPPQQQPQDFNNGGAAGFPSDNPSAPSGGFSGGGGGNSFTGKGGKLKTKPVAKADPKKPSMANANIEDITNENYPDLIESFDYPNAEITDVVKAISELTGKNFIVDPAVHGKITIMAPTQITVAEAYKAFLSALAINGFTIVPSGKFLKIKSTRLAAHDGVETYTGAYYPTSDVMITRIVHLKHISADEVNKNLRLLPSKDGEMTPYLPTNSLIISDFGSNMERIVKIISELDKAGFEEQMAVIRIRFAKAKDLADLIDQIINKDSHSSRNGGGFNAGVPRFRGGLPGASGGAPGSAEQLSLVTPDDRTNAIIVVGNKAGIDKIRELVHKLDYKLDPGESGGVYVYYVKYGEAEKISTTLQGLTSAQGSSSSSSSQGSPAGIGFGAVGRPYTPGATSIFGGDVKITPDKTNNSLVVTASKQDYDIVLSLLNKLDIARDQVYVQAIIMELNSNRTRTWDFNLINFNPYPDANGVLQASPVRSGIIGPNAASLLNPASSSAGAILGFGSGQTFNFTAGGTTIQVPSLLALVNFLQTQAEGNILSTPEILALDNEDASIEVGDRIPTSSSTTTANNGSTTNAVTMEDATIKLSITPHISPDSDAVRMKVEQTIAQLANVQLQSTTLAANTQSLAKRAVKTSIVVNSGDTAALGGLMHDEDSVAQSKVPILGDIPVLGWLFKSEITKRNKVNLMVFLTPKILRNSQDGHDLLNKKIQGRVEWLKRNFGGRDPYGKLIEELPRAQAAPGDEKESRRRQ
jgi:general secretion pathway protein D